MLIPQTRAAHARAIALSYLDRQGLSPTIYSSPQAHCREARFTFFLGTADPAALEQLDVPLFVSASRLAARRRGGDHMPKARTLWALDSGGFTMLQRHGCWPQSADEYGGMVTRLVEDCGAPPLWVAPQDWMCEPWIVHGGLHEGRRYTGTGLSVADHIALTVENYCYLRDEFPFIPWAPVVQGWHLEDYLTCIESYESAGIDLNDVPVVGLGSVCRRQNTNEITAIAEAIRARGIERLHGFGVKISGLGRYGHLLSSADSMAWSRMARQQRIFLPGCEHPPPCNNCLAWALVWRERVLDTLRSSNPLQHKGSTLTQHL